LTTQDLAADNIGTTQERARILSLFRDTRARTLDLVSTLKEDDFVVQTAFFTSPIKWHVGHVSWIYEAVMGKIDSQYGFATDEISAYLNSYYQQFGTPHDKGRRGAVSRPTTRELLAYFDAVSAKVENFVATHELDTTVLDSDSSSGDAGARPARYLLEMGIHHECQHQELMVYDLQHLLADRYTPASPRTASGATGARAASDTFGGMVRIEGRRLYDIGYNGRGYCYDVELPEHKVYLEPYMIGVYPVTNGEFLKFIEAGGYKTYRYWLSDGWEKVRSEGWEAPMYWTRDGDDNNEDNWYVRNFSGYARINESEPVSHVSYYEADAYCRWAGSRLPTEAEWEIAACWDGARQKKTIYPWGDSPPAPDRCNLMESNLWGCSEIGSYPDGVSASGCQQMMGDVWEWTSSEFVGYPGFQSGFDEYNDKWFANQKVLRGGSFGTPAVSIRGSYRNFFRLDERWMISGFRCARDDDNT